MRLLHGDCLELMAQIPDQSVDMILCDLPYGTTACKWDTVIPFEPLWAQYRRIAKRHAAIVLTASQPFTTALIASNMREFRYCWVWDKGVSGSFANAAYAPLRTHEDVCVFSGGRINYIPQMVKRDKPIKFNGQTNSNQAGRPTQHNASLLPIGKVYTEAFPKSVQAFSPRTGGQRGLHPTQKPVALMEYLIRTYTNEGETVMDNCMGSGTTGVACVNTGRKFIGMEQDAKYFEIAQKRIRDATLPDWLK